MFTWPLFLVKFLEIMELCGYNRQKTFWWVIKVISVITWFALEILNERFTSYLLVSFIFHWPLQFFQPWLLCCVSRLIHWRRLILYSFATSWRRLTNNSENKCRVILKALDTVLNSAIADNSLFNYLKASPTTDLLISKKFIPFL